MSLIDALRHAIAEDAALQALDQADAPRLELLLRFVVEAFPVGSPAEAVRFTQRVLNQQSLVMKRDAHGNRDQWLSPEERLLLAQQEVDWTALGHLVRAAFRQTLGEPAELAAQRQPLPLSASDHHHPAELDPHQPWMAQSAWIEALVGRAEQLVQQWETGDLSESPWEQRHTLVPEVLTLLARPGEGAFPNRALVWGYAGFLARMERLGQLRTTANHMLDPAAILEHQKQRRWVPPTLALGQYINALATAAGSTGHGAAGEWLAGIEAGYAIGVLEDAATSPLPAGR